MKGKKAKKNTGKMNVKIPAELHGKLSQHCKREGIVVESFVARSIEKSLASVAVAEKTRSGV